MKWFLEETYPKAKKSIQYGDEVVFFGSCFSQNILEKGQGLGFNFQTTNYGTIFHPIPMARIILDALQLSSDLRVIEQNNKFFSWDSSTKLFAQSKNEIEELLQTERKGLHEKLKSAKYLFLTFGTAKEYTNSEGLVVANCLKFPASNFKHKRTNLESLLKLYKKVVQELLVLNPTLEIVCTVSPVRHVKDGLIENNRSKARLLQLCEQLEFENNTAYFPAYELITDQLRDYRFYEKDLVHPNQVAIDFVWERFEEIYFSDETSHLVAKAAKFRAYFSHQPNGKETVVEIENRRKKEAELTLFLHENPGIVWKK